MFTSGPENSKQGNRKLTFLVMPSIWTAFFFCCKYFYNGRKAQFYFLSKLNFLRGGC